MGDAGVERRALRALHVLGWQLTPDMPPARMLVASAINWFGSGLFHTSVAVFAVAVLSVGPATVGIAFALGGVVGILLSVLVGRFADQRDAKAVLVGAYAVPGGCSVAYAAGVHDGDRRECERDGLGCGLGAALLVAAVTFAALLGHAFPIGSTTRE